MRPDAGGCKFEVRWQVRGAGVSAAPEGELALSAWRSFCVKHLLFLVSFFQR